MSVGPRRVGNRGTLLGGGLLYVHCLSLSCAIVVVLGAVASCATNTPMFTQNYRSTDVERSLPEYMLGRVRCMGIRLERTGRKIRYTSCV